MIEYIGARLIAWATWSEERVSGSLGYPRAAAFTRLGPGGGHFDGVVLISEECWEIERAVAAIAPELRAVAMAVYRVRGTTAQVSGLLHCSERTLYRRIDALHQAVMDWLLDYHVERGDGTRERRVRQSVRTGPDAGGAGAPGAHPAVVR